MKTYFIFTLLFLIVIVVGGCVSPLETQAKSGNADAMYQFGVQNNRRDYLLKAAEAGHSEAQYLIGKRLIENPLPGIAPGMQYTTTFTDADTGTTITKTGDEIRSQNIASGREWLKRSSQAGNDQAKALLAKMP